MNYDVVLEGENIDCPKSIIFLPLQEALQKYPTLSHPQQDGLFLYIPKNKNIAVKMKNVASILFLVDTGATLTLFHDAHDGPIDLTIIGKEKAHILVQHVFQTANTVLTETIELGPHALLQRHVAQLSETKVQTSIILGGEYAAVEDKELFFADKQQHHQLTTFIHHKAPNTSSKVLIKGLAKENGFCNARGLVRIDKEASKTTSHLAEHVLLLNKGAHADAVPSMEIEAQDVQAGHSASVSHLDENQLFYTMVRGIPYNEACKMIAIGFLAPIFTAFPNGEELLAQKWED